MISMKAIMDLAIAMPKCSVKKPEDGISLIKDTRMNTVAHIDWNQAHIMIYDDYEYVDEVIESIGKERFDIVNRPEYEDPVFEDFEEPDETELLYQEPPEHAVPTMGFDLDDEQPF